MGQTNTQQHRSHGYGHIWEWSVVVLSHKPSNCGSKVMQRRLTKQKNKILLQIKIFKILH